MPHFPPVQEWLGTFLTFPLGPANLWRPNEWNQYENAPLGKSQRDKISPRFKVKHQEEYNLLASTQMGNLHLTQVQFMSSQIQGKI